MSAGSRIRRWSIRCLYVATLALLFEGGAFLTVKAFDNELGNSSQRHLYSALRGHELNPGYRRAFDTGGRLIHSAQGFRRDGLIEVAKPAGVFRIFVLGGSALYGIGVQSGSTYPLRPTLANDQTVTFFLERDLNARVREAGFDVRIEVINAGVTAYQTFHHVLYFYETLYEYQPDLLLFLDGHNDFYNVDRINPIKAYSYSAAGMVAAFEPGQTVFHALCGQSLSRRIQLCLQAPGEAQPGDVRAVRGAPAEQCALIASAGRRFRRGAAAGCDTGFLRNYRMIDAFAQYHRFDYHVFLQPEIVFEDPRWLDPRDAAIKATTERLYDKERVEIMRRARPLFAELFARHGVTYTDIGSLAHGPGDRGQLYMDYCHLMPGGARAVAERMLPVVLDKV